MYCALAVEACCVSEDQPGLSSHSLFSCTITLASAFDESSSRLDESLFVCICSQLKNNQQMQLQVTIRVHTSYMIYPETTKLTICVSYVFKVLLVLDYELRVCFLCLLVSVNFF